MGIFKQVLYFLPLLTLYPVFFYVFPFMIDNQDISKLIKAPLSTQLNLEYKISLFFYLFSFVGLFFLLAVAVTALSRFVFYKPQPALEEDPPVIRSLNRVLQNSLEQALIFVPLLGNFIFNRSENQNIHQAINLTALWVLGRCLFLLGYLFGAMIGVTTLRGTGFTITVSATIYLAYDFVKAFLAN